MPDVAASPARSLIVEDDAPSFVGVKRALLARIGSDWKVGDRLPRVSELAKSMKVGQNNAQRAVTELVAEGVLFSRRRLGVFVRQVPGPSQQVAFRHSMLRGKTVAMAVFSEPVPSFVRLMMDGLQQVVEAAGGQTCLIDGNKLGDHDDAPWWGTALFNPGGSFVAPPTLKNLAIISTADHLHPQIYSEHDSVSVDQYQGGGLAGDLLRNAGCARACFLGRRVDSERYRYDMTSSARLNGMERAWGSHLDSANLLYVRGYSVHSGGVRFSDYLAMTPRPDGVFCASDELALGFQAAAASHGLTAGKDFQLIGFDGQFGQMADGSLTTIRVPALTMGQRAAELLIQRLAQPERPPQRILLPCTISSGDTCPTSHRSL